MRKILFRGKRLDNGEWEYGYYAVHHITLTDIDHKTNQMIRVGTRTVHAIFNDERKNESGYWKDVDPETVGQFTGLYDKDGKEIYEGDIIADGMNLHIIRYFEKDARFLACSLAHSHIVCGVDQTWIDALDKTVIGNIHDNHEILKGSEL